MSDVPREARRARTKIQTIQLEPYDDVVSVRDRLQFAAQRRVLLVFPPQGKILRRKLDLVLIQREALRRNLQIALLTRDPEVAENAASVGLSCFYTLRQARSRRWHSNRGRVFTDRSQRPADEIGHPYELLPFATRLKPELTPAQRFRRLLGRLLAALAVLVALLASMIVIIPSATVTLTPASDAINEPITITADPALSQIDVPNSAIPAQIVRVLVQASTVTIESSGRREGASTLAKGRVVFTNQTDVPLVVPAGTVVSSGSTPPARFSTLTDVPLAGEAGAEGETEITALADTPALAGNVPANSIVRVEGDLETLVSVRNPAPTFGGGLTEEAVVTQADYDRLLTLGRGAVQQAARSQLLLQLDAENKFLVPESIRIVEERPEWLVYSARIDDAAPSVSLEMRAVIEAMVIDLLEARQLAFLILNKRLPPGLVRDESRLNYRREEGGSDTQGRYTFQMFVEGDVPFAINADQVAGRINGMSVSQAQRTLENELLLDPRQPPQISLYPFDFGRLPILPVRIRVRVNAP